MRPAISLIGSRSGRRRLTLDGLVGDAGAAAGEEGGR